MTMYASAKKNLARSRAATVIGCLCLLVVCSLAAATTSEFETAKQAPLDNAVQTHASSDVSGSTGSNVDQEDGQSYWSQQPPKAALSESRPVTSASLEAASAADATSAGVSDMTNNSNNLNNNSNNNNYVVLPKKDNSQNNNNNNDFNAHVSHNCRPSMASNCRPLLAAQEMDAGQVCVSVQDGLVSVQVKANDFWTLLEASVWTAGDAGQTTVPIEQGRVDHQAFAVQSKPNMRSASWETSMTSTCLLYTSPSPRDQRGSRMPSSA